MDFLKRPENVGILAIEMYTPKRFVAQEDLETQDGCKGKYTVGLGQLNMAFVDDREDITSIFLTAVTNLLRKYNVDPMRIGRMEVGTETLIDKSKSVKTSLMSLFGDNSDLEGITNVNACYGGTAALFNSISWVESSEWDGRYALVVCGDIAVYEAGPARPTGGCGALAILVGPHAPLVLEPGVRASHMMDVYDFYKPQHSEYPVVDGKLSQWAYLSSIDKCYMRYKEKYAARYNTRAAVTVDHFDYFAMHTPYNKLIQKGFARLFLIDYKQYYEQQQASAAVQGNASAATSTGRVPIPESAVDAASYAAVQAHLELPLDETYEGREIETAFRNISSQKYKTAVTPCCKINQHVGNCYSGSVFSSLLSIVCDKGADLVGKRICMFSYGSGSAASLYSLIGRVPDVEHNTNFTLESIQRNANMLKLLHEQRTRCSVQEFTAALDLREAKYGKAPMTPDGVVSPSTVFPRTFYLVSVNDRHHRVYAQTPDESEWTDAPAPVAAAASDSA